jgi:hypothetical protein
MTEPTPDSSEAVEFAQWMQEASEEFDELCAHRMKLGEEKYGPGKWLKVDTLNEALFELADGANYFRMSFMRIRALQRRLEQIDPRATSEDFSKDLTDD